MSASRMHRIIACPASFSLENKMPYEPPSPAAARGTHIHELAEKILAGSTAFDHADEDLADLDMAFEYVEYVNKLRAHSRRSYTEVNVTEALRTVHPMMGGTADAVVVKDSTLHVVDLKTGRIHVSAQNNEQLLTYALGVAIKLKAPLEEIKVMLHIWQPNNINTWEIDGKRLQEHGLDLAIAANRALEPDAPAIPSVDACKYCKAKTICPAMREKAQMAARTEFGLIPLDETQITPEMLDEAEQAITWGESVQQAAKQQLKDGKKIQGWSLKPGRKMTSWANEQAAEQILRDNALAWTLKSVSQVSKLGINVAALIQEKQAEPSLARSK